jgi:hypothetical protein
MAEPILWAHKAVRTRIAKRWNEATQQMEVSVDPDTGMPRRETIPQRAHDPSAGYNEPRTARMQRSIRVLQHCGSIVDVPLSTGAADVEGLEQVGRYMRAKAQYFGWIAVGTCPLRHVAAGTLRPQQIRDPELRAQAEAGTAKPCLGNHGEERWCPHFVAEEKARKATHGRVQAKDALAYQTEADKMIKAGQQQTKDIVQGVATALADAVRAVAQPQPEPPAARKRGEQP